MKTIQKWWKASGEERRLREQMRKLYPLQDTDKQVEQYRRDQIKRAKKMTVIFACLAMVLLVGYTETTYLLQGERVERRAAGNGNYSVPLIADIDGESFDVTLEVEETILSEPEVEELFLAAEEEILSILPGENPSLEEVTYDLVLPGTLQEGMVAVDWSFDDYGIISGDGKLKDAVEKGESAPLTIRAEMTYASYTCSYTLYATVYEKTRSIRENMEKEIQTKLEQANKESAQAEEMFLPRESEYGEIYWEEKKSYAKWLIVPLLLIVCSLPVLRKRQELKDACMKRETQLRLDYPKIVNELTLLLGAGMTITTAWIRMSDHYEKRRENGTRYAYEEMLVTRTKLSKGMPESAALEAFGKSCGQLTYMKFTGLLTQNIYKGNKGITGLLEQEVHQAFEERKATAKQMGEEAGTKMLIPLGMLLVIVMVIVILPGLWSM